MLRLAGPLSGGVHMLAERINGGVARAVVGLPAVLTACTHTT